MQPDLIGDLSGLKDFQDSVPDALVHLAPAGRYVYRTPEPSNTKAPVALNPDLSGRGDMCPVSESPIKQMGQIARIIV